MIGSCTHYSARADVKVTRLMDDSHLPTGEVRADIRIACGQCGLPYKFVQLPAGYKFDAPTISADAAELRVPILAPS